MTAGERGSALTAGEPSDVDEHAGRRSSPIYIQSSSPATVIQQRSGRADMAEGVVAEGPAPVMVDDDMVIDGQDVPVSIDAEGADPGGHMDVETVHYKQGIAQPGQPDAGRSTVLQEIDEHMPPGRLRNIARSFHDELQEENRRLQEVRELKALQRKALENVRSLSRKLRIRMERLQDG